MEYKSLPSFVKSVDQDTRTIVGIFAVHGNTDSYLDISHPGSFRKTIAERGDRVKFLWGHDFYSGPPTAKVLGLREIGRDELPDEVLSRAPNATGGVEITRRYYKTGRASEVFDAVADGGSDEMSYGFDPIIMDFSEVDGQQVRNLREVRLWEVSDVIFGANPATQGSKLMLPPDLLLKHIECFLAEIKAGARHSTSDTNLLNAIHKAALELGATNCKGLVEEEEKQGAPPATTDPTPPESRAEPAQPISLTLEKARLFLLDYV
jgi:hypothetical protein